MSFADGTSPLEAGATGTWARRGIREGSQALEGCVQAGPPASSAKTFPQTAAGGFCGGPKELQPCGVPALRIQSDRKTRFTQQNVLEVTLCQVRNPAFGKAWLRTEGRDSNGHLHTYVHSSTIHHRKRWTQPRCPSADEWINKMWSLRTTGRYSVFKRKAILDKPGGHCAE